MLDVKAQVDLGPGYSLPAHQIQVSHSEGSQVAGQKLALQESLRLQSSDITVTGDSTDSSSFQEAPLGHIRKQTFSLVLVLSLACLAITVRILPYQVSENPAMYSSSCSSILPFLCRVSPWPALKENLAKRIWQNSLHVWCLFPVIFLSTDSPPLHTGFKSSLFMLLYLGFSLYSWLSSLTADFISMIKKHPWPCWGIPLGVSMEVHPERVSWDI